MKNFTQNKIMKNLANLKFKIISEFYFNVTIVFHTAKHYAKVISLSRLGL